MSAWQAGPQGYNHPMSVTLPAIRKGDTLALLQPLEGVPEGTPVLVTIRIDEEREDLLRLSDQGLELAYGDDEPDYTEADLLPDDEE